nr:uncharacterized protein LOC129271453 [Lytechinus pictus]
MYHQTITNAFASLILAATLLSTMLSSLTEACGSKGSSDVTTPKPQRGGRPGVQRLRRELGMDWNDETIATSNPESILTDELVHLLEQDIDDEEVTVIDWISEGHSVRDFLKLLNIFDKDGDDRISISEIVNVIKEQSKPSITLV